ncbi:MAG: N-acetylmuramoyl-L-alanine amidase [Sphingobacteriales bacterium]|nr:MAG: N-acetylmuramoyl-L-alanine amidase [Sphingobacteriales bacterium]
MIYLSAGHNLRSKDADPGAVCGKLKEAFLTAELRDLVAKELQLLSAKFVTDTDDETLSGYIRRIKPGNGSVLCELHFNCAANLATGAEVLVKNEYCKEEKELATAICNIISSVCTIANRGVKTESQSHRGKLGILHTHAGISVLVEVCFINNKIDMQHYQKSKKIIAAKLAEVLIMFDELQS